MKEKESASERWRIAVISPGRQMQAQKTLLGICQRADLADNVSLKFFDAFDLGFERGIVEPLKKWKPDGLLIRLIQPERMALLRRTFPKAPIVSVLLSPPAWVNACVASDSAEAIALACDHFQACGLQHVALFCCALPDAASRSVAAFQDAVPDGPVLKYPADGCPQDEGLAREWLLSLPKPVGVLTLECGAAPFVLKRCQEADLRVPEDVQLIGVDAEDLALAQEPHMTSLALPRLRTGERALETLLRYLRDGAPPAAEIVRVPGTKLVPRDSTAVVNAKTSVLAHALKYMEEHVLEGLSTAQVARQAGMSLSVFYKEFTAATGVSPARHLRRLRLKVARRMLQNSSATVTAIAQKCGFKDLIAFVHFFRRETGQTPTAYRQRAADKDAADTANHRPAE